ncbi:GIGYF family protein Gyf-like isoform X2 [Neocloeon triangulifer]|uniref:GIGYF family protein Gyf-like isoform X2 n=1 Tax=Neocloeon triangulifer TaxID=2078957 RepID=UPI00286F609B|nr:GIGYF family protein Gyf-like isoform X2 [Neocloeon triangulifer]
MRLRDSQIVSIQLRPYCCVVCPFSTKRSTFERHFWCHPSIMTDSLKFGPEWLRNLTQASDSGSGGTGGGTANITPRYQLADYRYGREEMLAMFGNIKPSVPDGLDSFPMLFLEKPLPPLALIQMTEEETRMWQRGINSEVAVRTSGYGRGSGPVPIGGRGLPLQNSSNYGPVVGRGRGGRFSNGRGRFDEDAPREPGGGFPINNYASRGRFERSVSGQERTWNDKAENGVEWSGGSVSPRRELKPFFGKPPIDNWRNNSIEGGEDGPPVRRPSGSGMKWNRASSWRDAGGKEREDWHGEGDHGKDYKYHDTQENDKDSTSEKRYSFKILDAIKEVKEISHRKEMLTKELDDLDKKVKYYEEQEKSGSCQIVDYAESFTKKHSIQSDIKKLGEIEEALIEKIKLHLSQNPRAAEMDPGEGHFRRHHDGDLPEWATSNPTEEGGSFDDSGAFHGGVFFCEDGSEGGCSPMAGKISTEPSPERLSEGHKNAKNRQEEEKREEVKQPKQVSHVKPIIPKYEQQQESIKKQPNRSEQPANILPLIMGEKSNEKWPEKLVDDVVKDDMGKEDNVRPTGKEGFWFYLDPQGFEQGKFSSEQMLAWTKSGFFPPNLKVRRDSEGYFSEICRFPEIWEQASLPATVQEPIRNELPHIPTPLSAAAGNSGNPASKIVNNSSHNIQTEFILRQFEEVERVRLDRLSFEPEDGYLSPDESFESRNFDKQMIWNELKKEKERREMHKGLGGTFSNYLPLDPSTYPSLKPTTAWISQWMQKQFAKLASGKKRFLPEEKEMLILFKMHEKKLELDKKEKVMRVMPNVAPGDSWHLPTVPSVPDSLWGSEPAAQPTSRLVESLWGDLDPIPLPQSVPSSMWGLANSNGIPHPRQQFSGTFDKVEADALELEKLAAEATSRRENHRREENLRIQKEIEAAKKAIEMKRLEEEKKLQEEAEKQRQEMIARQIEMEKERIRLEQEMQKKKMEEEAAMRQREMERKLAEEEERRREHEEKERKKAKKAQEEALKKQQQQAAARKKELEMQSVQQVEAQMKQQKQEQMKRLKEQQKQQELLKQQQQQQELQRQLDIQRQQELRKQQEIMLEQQRKKEAKAAGAAKAAKTAPWLQQAATMKNSVTSLAEIQKLQKEETQREIAAVQEQRSKMQQSLFVEEPSRPWEASAQKVSQTMLNLQQIQEEQKKSRIDTSTYSAPPMPIPMPISNPVSNTWNSAWSQAPTQTVGIWGQSATSKVIAKPVHSTQPAPQAPAPMPASIWNADPEPVQSAPPAAQKTTAAAASAAKKKPAKNKSKKEEAQVMKIFESKSFSDDFTAWCVQSLSALDSDVEIDIPTFVSFLKDIESPFDINDYVRSYLGNGQEAREFAKNFIEKRSKWRNSQRRAIAEDDMCKPAPAVNPNDSDFLEVKGKAKKIKKKPMMKVDSRILGFNVTAAPDRLNVGDRDYGE